MAPPTHYDAMEELDDDQGDDYTDDDMPDNCREGDEPTDDEVENVKY